MTAREQRVADAIIEAVKRGDWTEQYVILMIEDDMQYGWMSQTCKDYIYEHIGVA